MVELFTKQIVVQGQTYKLHNKVKNSTIQAVNKWLNTPAGELGLFKSLTGQTSIDKKEVRKVVNGIIKARNKPNRTNNREIKVILNDREVKLRPLKQPSF